MAKRPPSKSVSKRIREPKADRKFDCSSAIQASNKTGMRKELILALKAIPTEAFHPSGRIDSEQLIKDAASHPDIVKIYADMPDLEVEKALTARVTRREAEVKFEQTLQNIAPLDICRRILIRGGSMVRGKLMAIPDRISEWCALETEAPKIRERIIFEIGEALKSISEEPVDKIIKDVLAD